MRSVNVWDMTLRKEAYHGPGYLHLQAEGNIMFTCNHVMSTPLEVIPLS